MIEFPSDTSLTVDGRPLLIGCVLVALSTKSDVLPLLSFDGVS